MCPIHSGVLGHTLNNNNTTTNNSVQFIKHLFPSSKALYIGQQLYTLSPHDYITCTNMINN